MPKTKPFSEALGDLLSEYRDEDRDVKISELEMAIMSIREEADDDE